MVLSNLYGQLSGQNGFDEFSIFQRQKFPKSREINFANAQCRLPVLLVLVTNHFTRLQSRKKGKIKGLATILLVIQNGSGHRGDGYF